MATCYRHPSRETGVSCSSCGNPICPDCMTPTPVGMRCPDCAGQKTKVRTAASLTVEPRVTYALIAINVAVFIAQVMSEGGGRAEDGRVYVEGALVELFVADGDWWRIFTSAFLHDSPIHLLLNMVVLYFLGQMLEPAYGHLRFVAVYVASLFAGSLGAVLLQDNPLGATIGASGAVYGLMGAAVLFLLDRRIPLMQTFIGPLIIINVLFTLSGVANISIGGHLGGLAGGALAAALIIEADRRRLRWLPLAGCAVVAVACAAGAIAAAQSIVA